ncbi:MAG: hypothetical protein AB7E80_09430 [Hyphomicrobiaceae bacterium]
MPELAEGAKRAALLRMNDQRAGGARMDARRARSRTLGRPPASAGGIEGLINNALIFEGHHRVRLNWRRPVLALLVGAALVPLALWAKVSGPPRRHTPRSN